MKSIRNMVIYTNNLFTEGSLRKDWEGQGHRRGWAEQPDPTVYRDIPIMTPILIKKICFGPSVSSGRTFKFGFTWTEGEDESKCNLVIAPDDVTYYMDEIEEYEIIKMTDLSRVRHRSVMALHDQILNELT